MVGGAQADAAEGGGDGAPAPAAAKAARDSSPSGTSTAGHLRLEFISERETRWVLVCQVRSPCRGGPGGRQNLGASRSCIVLNQSCTAVPLLQRLVGLLAVAFLIWRALLQ